MKLTEKGAKFRNRLAGILVIVAGLFGLRFAAQKGYGREYLPTFMAPKVALDDRATVVTPVSNVELGSLPSTREANLPGPEVRAHLWAWNAQAGCLFANGGPVTTEGSLMAKQGVKLRITRQDDNNILMAELTALAKAMHDGNPNPTEGTMFVAIMGDGAHMFIDPLNKQLVKAFGEEYRAEIIGSCGQSFGEDKLMGPVEWKTNPQSMRGAVIAGVIGDGDFNIGVRYALDNSLPINPDETTYDPNAVNWIRASTYIDAARKVIEGYTEPRKVIVNGKLTGETKIVRAEGAVTWTPGDVNIARELGGLVSVVSTKEYKNQMPNVLIGVHKWNQTHRATVEKMLDAFTQGGDQVISHDEALTRASEISAKVYNEETAEYWKKYYIGVREADKTGLKVDLGGSRAYNLADNLLLFGLVDGTTLGTSRFNATYTVFGDLLHKMYPNVVGPVKPVEEIVDVSYLKAVASRRGTSTKAEVTQYAATDANIEDVVGRRDVAIEFATGQSTLTAAGVKQLEKLANELNINDLRIEIHGHTDNVGNSDANQQLSEDRAMAVKEWLVARNPVDFPSARMVTRAHGDEQPVASNRTPEGRQKNRRVEIVIGR